jgi:glycosyltransferase involved in cell wall biosynthesis
VIALRTNKNNTFESHTDSLENDPGSADHVSSLKTKIFIVVPYFLEMNGPESHYGTLLTICKSLDFDVNYVATEKSFIHSISESSFKNFNGISLIRPHELKVLFSKNSLIVNCGSPWIYRNIQELNAAGSLIIDYLFNHVGHTANNLLHRDILFHTVSQHKKLNQILVESTNDSWKYSCIPIPFPKVGKSNNLLESKKENILWIGRLSPEKGVERLVEISRQYFKQTGKSIRVIGGGKLAKELQRGIQLGSIDFAGELSHSQTLKEIEFSKVVINTSFVEGVSMVAMEALSSGSFVVSFDVGGMSELLWHPQMRINRETIQDFVQLMISLENTEVENMENLPLEYEHHSHTRSWTDLLITARRCLS